MKYILTLTLLAVVAFAASEPAKARHPKNFLPLSLSYSVPGGGLSDSIGAKGSLGFSIGYRLATSKHVRVGIRGTWTRMSLGEVQSDTGIVDFSTFGLTHIGVLGGVQYRLNKHGWSPYAELEGGMGMLFADELISNQPRKIDGLSEVKWSAAGVLGVLIPLSPQLDVDISGRYQSTFVSNGFTTISAHVGIVYALK